jgi:hypothetical protein
VSAHLVSSLLLLGFTLTMYLSVRAAQRAGRLRLSVRNLWALLAVGYLLTAGRYVQTMDRAEWLDGLIVFIALCGALPIANLIRRVCPSCQRQLELRELVVRRPTRSCPGVGSVLWSCQHCAHHAVRTHTIPRLAETAAEAVPWVPSKTAPEGGFGGTYAAGSSGSASWTASTPEAAQEAE